MSPFHNFSSRDIKTSITKQNLCFSETEKLNLAEHENQRHILALQYMHTIHSIWLDAKDRRSYFIIRLFLFYFIAKHLVKEANESFLQNRFYKSPDCRGINHIAGVTSTSVAPAFNSRAHTWASPQAACTWTRHPRGSPRAALQLTSKGFLPVTPL